MLTKAAAERRACAWLIYTACVWGANVVVLKAMTNEFAIVHLSAIRMAVAFVCIAAICRFTGHRIVRLNRAQFGWLSAAAALMIYAHQLLRTRWASPACWQAPGSRFATGRPRVAALST